MPDEDIVQAASKDAESLSRRLHHFSLPGMDCRGSDLAGLVVGFSTVAQYKQVNKLGGEDAAYIAGLIDGEGTVALTRRHRNENRQLEISISSTEFALLDFVLEKVGAGRITRKKRYSEKHSFSAVYAVSNRQALSLLKQILPYLRSYKAKRGELILANYARLTPRNGKYTPELIALRAGFLQEFGRIQASTYQQLDKTAEINLSQ